MAIPRLYYPAQLDLNKHYLLPITAAHHASRVLRLKSGDRLALFNGDGQEYSALISKIHKQQVEVFIQNKQVLNRESTLSLHLGQALTRGEKMDWIIQKAVELGVNYITPLQTQHCAIHYNATQLIKKMQHWRNIIISACEQSSRTCLPILNDAMNLNDWLSLKHPYGILLAPEALSTLGDLRLSSLPNAISVAIGPEGGWHEQEIFSAKRQGFYLIRLGPRILRTETAALAALSTLQLQWGDFA